VGDGLVLDQSFHFADAAVDGEDNVAEGFGVLERHSVGDGASPQDFRASGREDQADLIDRRRVSRDPDIEGLPRYGLPGREFH
jgi:hypothetical protein